MIVVASPDQSLEEKSKETERSKALFPLKLGQKEGAGGFRGRVGDDR